jgi:hypothetical protein
MSAWSRAPDVIVGVLQAELDSGDVARVERLGEQRER